MEAIDLEGDIIPMSTARELRLVKEPEVEHYLDGINGARILSIWDTFDSPEAGAANVEGSEYYDQRGAVLPGSISVVKGDHFDQTWLDYLHSVGMGADTIIAIGFDERRPSNERFLEDQELQQRVIEKASEVTGGLELLVHPYNYTAAGEEAWKRHEESGVRYFGPHNGIARELGDKIRFIQLSEELGLPVGRYGVIEREEGIEAIERQLLSFIDEYEGDIFVRGNYGSSGSSAFPVMRETAAAAARRMYEDEADAVERFLVQPKYTLIAPESPSMLFRNNGHTHRINRISGQVMEGTEHEGNFHPSGLGENVELMLSEYGMRFARGVAERGYVNAEGGIDFLNTEEEGVIMGELNPRVTGATPLAYLDGELRKRHGDDIKIVSFNIHDYSPRRARNHEELATKMVDRHGESIVYDGSKAFGTIATNMGPFRDYGKFSQVVIGRSSEEIGYLVDLTTSILNDERARTYVRDSMPELT